MSDEEDVQELRRILVRINEGLKQVLTVVKDPKIRAAVERLEKLSRWEKTRFPTGQESFTFAIERAKMRAKDEGEPFVIAQRGPTQRLVLIAKRRFYEEHPFGLQGEHVIYDTDPAQKCTK